MSAEKPGLAIRVDKFGSTFEWTRERGWRVTSPSGLVMPPWDLRRLERDPYELDDAEVRWRYGHLLGLTVSGQLKVLEQHIERDIDPHRRDGLWPELAFMPHVSVPWLDFRKKGEPVSVEVPAYLTVGEALAAEQRMQYERAARALVARIEREQERWSRLWRFVVENASEAE